MEYCFTLHSRSLHYVAVRFIPGYFEFETSFHHSTQIPHPAIFTPLKINRIVLFPLFVTLFRSLVLHRSQADVLTF